MKVWTSGHLLTERDFWERLQKERQGKKVVFTNGCFDLLHVGHVRYLKEARQLGDLLVVGLNSDASVQRLKGRERPLQKEDARGEILSSLFFVDYVLLFDEDTPFNLIKKILPDVLVKGGDWEPSKIVGADVVLAHGGEVRSLQFVEGYSTTHLWEQLKKL
ncbi:MAG: D-glycero-beta-D-manno-heptose 1-phosphate adenylyltransferase [Bdellovibrio sp.]|nr:MAG: D-glycero-beta-D-manno-heptose 1-phosphate adenylyltransferase [Bdellovibrio sp.]